MAYATIQGQTPLGTTKPTNLKAAIGTNLMAAAGAPAGIGVSVAGMLTNSSPGMYGLVLGFSTPSGSQVDTRLSGSSKTKGSNEYDMMLVVVTANASVKDNTTEYWEVWFKQSDVDGDDWSTEVLMQVGGDDYSYVLTKKRTGDGLDDGLTDDQLAPSGYDRRDA
ncbi:MAG TPA: hypothetical protein PKN30_14860 [Flavobacteriales bacterium]|nr:hypothetical protein [Flavobacteriales bacterium]